MGELVHQHVKDQIIAVTTDLETFDDPNFHNKVQRINANS